LVLELMRSVLELMRSVLELMRLVPVLTPATPALSPMGITARREKTEKKRNRRPRAMAPGTDSSSEPLAAFESAFPLVEA